MYLNHLFVNKLFDLTYNSTVIKRRIKKKALFFCLISNFIFFNSPVDAAAPIKKIDHHLLTPVDLSGNPWTWTTAFSKMNQLLAAEYALTAHKNIQWDSLKQKYLPLITEAQTNNDEVAYYKALRSYILELHDGHSVIASGDKDSLNFASELIKKNTAGSYGFVLSKVNDGRYIASYIEANSPAAKANMQLGAEILEWNGKPIEQMIAHTDIVWNDENEPTLGSASSYTPSTHTGSDYERNRMLLLCPIGTRANIVFNNPDSAKKEEKTLTAVDDHQVIANKTRLYLNAGTSLSKQKTKLDPGPDPSKLISVKWLDKNIVQLKVTSMADGDYQDPDQNEKESPYYKYLVNVMTEIIDKKPKGIIVDLRGNVGGDGRLALDIADFFTPAPYSSPFLIKLTVYNTVTNDYQPISGWGPYRITGQTIHYDGPAVVLTDIGTISAGEWAALAFKQLGKPILSFYPNTQGAFVGEAGEPYIILPKKFFIAFTSGRGYDQNDHILVDSNAKLEGGVKTDIVIPFDAKTAIAVYSKNEDYALAYAVAYLKK